MLKFNDNYKEPTTTLGGVEYELAYEDHQLLKDRRTELGYTQQQVADIARIQLRQYQRLESGERSMSGASLRIGLSICAALHLDPYRFVPEMLSAQAMPESTK